jgi:hypothetical protein
MEPLTLSLLIVLAFIVLVRRPGAFSPVLAGPEEPALWPGTPATGDDEDQMPETDRAPRWLPWSVATVAVARVALLVTLHA